MKVAIELPDTVMGVYINFVEATANGFEMGVKPYTRDELKENEVKDNEN